jgi:hypothetical protein
MNFNWLRLALAAIWLCIGAALLGRDFLGLNWLSDRYPAENLNLGGGLGLAFAVWNAARWYSGRRRSIAPSRPLTPKPTEHRPFEYNPELDFHKPDADAKPPESR